MRNDKFVATLMKIATECKTIYGLGAYGWPMNAQNKERLYARMAYNRKPERKAIISAADGNTFAFDCILLGKSIGWGFDFDPAKINGGAIYGSNGVPDYDTEQMIKACRNVSSNFSSIKLGEFLWIPGHCGYYVGNNKVVECTPRSNFTSKDGVQITLLGNVVSSGEYPARTWQLHGELPFITYDAKLNGVVWENSRPYLYIDGEKYTKPGEILANGWHFIESDGTVAVNKEVWLPYIFQDETEKTDGKWVRYDGDGNMIYGKFTNEKGTYYYDTVTGAMYHGEKELVFRAYFNPITGILESEEIK